MTDVSDHGTLMLRTGRIALSGTVGPFAARVQGHIDGSAPSGTMPAMAIRPETPPAALPPVPVLVLAPGTDAALALVEHAPASARRLLDGARRRYSRAALACLDGPSRRWMSRNDSPYRSGLAAAERSLRPHGSTIGFWGLNTSYEWACTAGVDAAGIPRHLRVLDWDTPGLGRELHATVSGDTVLLTWPGFGGCVTGMRRGAFSLALNQPPLPGPVLHPSGLGHLVGQGLGWLRSRGPRWASRAMPPSHLVRMVLERCRTAAEALDTLRDTPVCAGAILSMAGTGPGEAWTVEKDVDRFAVRHGAAVFCANHWPSDPRAIARRDGSRTRADAMARTLAGADAATGLDWLRPPVLVPATRLACVMVPRDGTILVQGWEPDGPATRPTHIG